MPCRDYNDNNICQSDLDAAVNRIKQELEPLLCEACSILNDLNLFDGATKELTSWYEKHEECEKHRVAYEAALKLTARERRLLGINLEALKNLAAAEKSRNR